MGRYSAPLDAAVRQGQHRVRLRDRASRHARDPAQRRRQPGSRFTGRGEPFLFGAGDSTALQEAAAAATKRRKLDMTAVLKGLGLPTPGQVPPVCSMGGLGNFFHPKLIPTLAMISGPWSLYAPSFRESAIDYGRMRVAAARGGRQRPGARRAAPRADRRRLPGDARAAGAGGADLSAREVSTVRAWARAVRRSSLRRAALGAPAPTASAAITQPPQPKSGPGGSDYTHRGWRVSAGGSGLRRLVRVRAGQAAAAHRSARRGDARLRRVRGLQPDVRVHPAHGAQGEHRDLPALADQHRDPVPRADQHRAVHEVVAARDPRRAGAPAGAAEEACAAGPPANELLRVLVRRHRHREPHEPVSKAASAEAAGDLARGPARRRPRPGSTSPRWTTPCAGSRRP